MNRIAAYYRLSLEDMDKQHRLIDESQGISNQRKLVGAFIARHKELSCMETVEYFDDGFTGTNFDRPQFAAMMESAKRGEITCIVVKDLSRFGRNYLEVGDYLEHVFPFLGVRFISVNDNYDSNDYVGKTSGMDVAFRNFIYDSYSKDLSVKVRSAMRVRMEQGRFVNHVPYGYQKSPLDKHKMIPDPQTAPIVREIFLMAAGGKNSSQIAKELNGRGIPTPLEYKGHKAKRECEKRERMWSHTKILNILHNYKYTGAMLNHLKESRHMRDRNQRRVPRDEWIVTENAHEAIVSQDEFDAASRAIRQVKYTSHETGDTIDRVFYCGHCGRKLRKTFGADTYFSCDTPMYLENAGCQGIRWSKTALEDVLLPIYEMQLVLLSEESKKKLQTVSGISAEQFTRRIAQLEKEILSCDNEKIRLYEQYREGKMNRDSFIRHKSEQDSRKIRLQEEITKSKAAFEEQEKASAKKHAELQETEKYLSGLTKVPDEIKTEMYAAIERVNVISNDRISVQWKFRDLITEDNGSNQKAG